MMTRDTLVSIIVPVYNAGSYIEETLRMVEAQTYTDWELVLVDDCSKDNSRQLIEAYILSRNKKAVTQISSSINLSEDADRIRLFAKEHNEGAARARNTGIQAARGRYIAFLDADDIWLQEKLTKEMDFMKNKQAAFVFSAYEFGDEEAKATGKIVHVPQSLTYKQALSRTVIFTTTVLLDTAKTGKDLICMPEVKSEDSAAWWKILKSGITAYGLDEVLAIYRRPAKSLSSNKLEAVKRIWFLYRKVERLPLIYSMYNFVCWAFRAVLRRL